MPFDPEQDARIRQIAEEVYGKARVSAIVQERRRPARAEVSHPFDPESILGMAESLTSLAFCFAGGLRLVEPLSERVLPLLDPSQVFDFEPTFAPAGKAGIYAGFKVVPHYRYRSLLAAIVENHDADVGIEIVHSWPVLFLRAGGDNRTIAEAGGAYSASGGGDTPQLDSTGDS